MTNQFLTNYSETTFLEKIKDNLRHCESFHFSVSFIKKAGLVLLYKDIEAAIERGCEGRIITSTYQNFTDIESLKSFFLMAEKHDNFECHLDYECFHDAHYSTLGYHTKGYLFEFDNCCELIVGSSNITRYALLKNIEWDVVVRDELCSDVYSQALSEFEDKWDNTHCLNTDIINQYSNKLHFAIERWDMDYDFSASRIKPNFMQRRALKELNRYRAVGTSRTLVVAAAGSGKTYLAAFDALNFNPKRLLYIVHEGSILRKSLETFQDVFGSTVSYGIFNGESKEFDADFVFATNLTMHKSLGLFSKDDFDYIIIDECHHAAATTYKKVISYFEPEFLLGLTATPERMDNQDVFSLFDKNVPYELRLRDAIINDLIVPFRYYGIRDQLVDYGLNKNEERRMIAQIASESHCDFIEKEIEAHRPPGKLKALAFCRNVTHARMMCEAMGERFRTAYLTGANNIGERIRAYNDLQSDKADLEILFTVDILNEGVDIPGVNMVLFLRPTESSTVFIQQLGRGLRKYDSKPYVTVLDFIGNSYKRSVQIAFALSSSLSNNFVMEKRLMSSLVTDNFSALGLEQYGVVIDIDDLSKEEILEHIDNENFNRLSYLEQDYYNFKKYIGTEFYVKHMDYLNNDCAPDLIRFMNIKINGRKTCSYYNFLRGIDEKDLPIFTDKQIKLINYLSGLLPLVRPHEYLILKLIAHGTSDKESINDVLTQNISGYQRKEMSHAVTYMECITSNENQLRLDAELDEQLEEYLDDLLSYGLTRYNIDYGDVTTFKLWQSYRMDQVQLKLCKNPGYNMKGTYIYDNTVYIFASIKKDATLEEHLLYNDKFLQPDLFQWECEAGLNSEKQKELINSSKAHLFVRKISMENGITLPFTYVGAGVLTNPRNTSNPKGTLLFDIKMDEVLPDYLQYDFKWKSNLNEASEG
jgi:superfamily II DNA or RNA helicase